MSRRPIRTRIATHAGEVTETAAADELRGTMSQWPSGVAVLAVRERSRIEAITLNSLISISLDPPLVLVSIAASAQIRPVIEAANTFAISMLAADQSRIASQVADRMPGTDGLFTADNAPVVIDAIGHLICEIADIFEAGDHILYLAHVRHAQPDRSALPLVYMNGRYGLPGN
jgi:flavin reductase (DIM6/NTAB) family NADH-FMN oxidoreductase RutF